MTITLHLGVVDVPYAAPANVPRRASAKSRKGGKAATTTSPAAGAETTGDVATFLEDRYHVMEVFVEDVGLDFIAKAFEQSAGNAVAALIMGAPSSLGLTDEATSEIEAAFKLFLSQQEMDGIVPGVPTGASLRGVNPRLKNPTARGNPPRPSFIASGLYQASFKTWVD